LSDFVSLAMVKCGERIGNIFNIGESIFEYRHDSHGAEDYLDLCGEIIERE